jgi:predicted nucleic acid-binding Zn ribbon protein
VDEIGKLLPTLLKKEMRRPEPRILEVLVPLWPRIAGKAMAQHTRPASFELGTLTLHTNCPTWALQLRQMSEEIRSKVNSVLGRETVKKLRVRAVDKLECETDSKKLGRSIARELAPADLQNIRESIADPEIASALASSYAKYFHRPRS